MENFTLELLHFADQEAGAAAVVDAPNLSAVLNALRAEDVGGDGEADNTLTLSSGDAIIPGLFFDASDAVYGSAGIADIEIQNQLGVQAIALGNHEFDFGTATLSGLIDGSAEGTILGGDFTGTDFPYLSANLDFAPDADLAGLAVEGGGAPQANSVTSSVVIDVNGENIGVVGATTPTLGSISNPGSVGIQPTPFGADPTDAELDALAAEIQNEVDALIAANAGLNKVILLSHMQQISIEQMLAERLSNVDIIVAGGSNTRLFDDDDRPRDGDSDQGQYPIFIDNANGGQTAVVNTDGSYKYVGRLVIDFDADGNIIADSYDEAVSGAYATDAQGVAELNAAGLVDPEIQQIADEIEAQIIATESNVFGISDVFLNGNRSGDGATADPDGVRTQETNLGTLTALANLVEAQKTDPDVVVSLKNGGGIRASIGETLVPPGGSEAERTPNGEVTDADGNVVKPEGGISQNDIQTTLAFNNGLTLLTLTREEIVALLEHGVGALPGVSGRFPQFAGVKLSFDESQPTGDRIQNAVIVDENDGVIANLVEDGVIAGDPSETFRVVTLSFLAAPRFDDSGNFTGGGDGYPFPNSNSDPSVGEVGDPAVIARLDIEQLVAPELLDDDETNDGDVVNTGDATFAPDGSEQDALAEFLDDNFGGGDDVFSLEDTGPGRDDTIQQIAFRTDTVGAGTGAETLALDFYRRLESGSGEGGSEVVAYEDGKAYVTNGEEGRIDVFDVATGVLDRSIDLTGIQDFDGVQSVAVKNGVVAAAVSRTVTENAQTINMMDPEGGFATAPLLTIGGVLDNGYQPVGVLDGLGAMQHPDDDGLVRVYANHELLNFRGNEYEVDGITLTGARISYFDIDKETKSIVDGGIAYNAIYDANGERATDTSLFTEPFAPAFGGQPGDGSELAGFSRFCSAVLVEAGQFGDGRGLESTIFFAGEEDGGGFNSVGGGEWALDTATGDLWHVPSMGRGAWENVTEIDTGTTTHVAFILADDSSPFDVDDFDANQAEGDADREAAPLFLYVGEKDASGDFLSQNGLRDGKLYVWVADEAGVDSPAEFNGMGTKTGDWVEIDNTPVADPAMRSQDGSTGFDEFGYPTQRTLWSRAEDVGAFGFSRPEDVATNPDDGSEIVLASTGVDTFDIDPGTGNGVDTFGTMYTVKTDFADINNPTADLTIVYDGDADAARALRSPDNLDWADDGFVYIQEDEAEEDTASGDEVLFGEGAANPNEASIVRLDPTTGAITRVAEINRDALPEGQFDADAGSAGEWESSGILDVSSLFGDEPGSLFLYTVQAHGIEDQEDFALNETAFEDNPIQDNNLVEGGQLAFLSSNGIAVQNPINTQQHQDGVVATFDTSGNQTGEFLVGNLPDSLTFTPDGSKIVVANEGEPTEVNTDPAGSISIIDLGTGQVVTLGFEAFDGQEDSLREQGVRIFPGRAASLDLEPEYVTASPDGSKAYISLQEANAYATVDLATNTLTGITSFGTVDHSQEGSGIDPSDRDDAIDIAPRSVQGLRMPDAIASFAMNGTTYLLTANEGDDRGAFDEGGEAARVGDILDGDVPGLSIDDSVDTAGLERLNVSTIDGDTDGDGDLDELFSYGSRGFTIFDADTGAVVFDSGDQFARIAADLNAVSFNDDDDNPNEDRSDNKGVEPEAITVGQVGDATYAFIGLERDGGIVIYNISDPANAEYVTYMNGRTDGDVSPEVLTFVPASESVSGVPQLLAAYEVSGTTVAYDLNFAGGTGDSTFDLEDLNGQQKFDGGPGDDSVIAPGNLGDAELTPIEGGFRLENGPDGAVDLLSVENFQFDDGTLAVADDPGAADLYRLYETSFGRAPDFPGITFWYDLLEQGILSFGEIADFFVAADEFSAPADNATFVASQYQMALQRDPDGPGSAFWTGLLDDGTLDRSDVMAAFATAEEAQMAFQNETDDGVLLLV